MQRNMKMYQMTREMTNATDLIACMRRNLFKRVRTYYEMIRNGQEAIHISTMCTAAANNGNRMK